MIKFGSIEHMAWWKISGKLTENEVLSLGKDLSLLAEMTLDGEPDIRRYPTDNGNGGVGIQVYFPWVESWMIIGTWPELNLIRIAMSTCAIEKFVPDKVGVFLELIIGPIREKGFARW